MRKHSNAIIIVIIVVASLVSASGCLSLGRVPEEPSLGGKPPVSADQPAQTPPPATPPTTPPPATTPPTTVPTPPAPPPIPTTPDNSGRIIRTGKIPVVTGIAPGTKRVALTFDAGWIYETAPALLATLDKYGVRSTFFLRAAWVKDHPDLAREIVARGHDVESHSFTHPNFTTMTDDQIRADLDQAQAAFHDVLGIKPTLFRPPYGAYNKHTLEMLDEYGFKASVMWTVDTLDWKEPGVDAIVNKATGASDGSIVLMHVGSAQTIDALPTIITALRAKGFTLVTVPELLGDRLGATLTSH